MRFETRHASLYFKEESPVLNDKGIGAKRRTTPYEVERIAHFVFFDDDIDGDVDARSSEMRCPACVFERIIIEIRCFAASVKRAHAAVDSVGASGERGGKRFGASGWS